MKIKIDRKILVATLGDLKSIATTSGTIPILSNIMIQAIDGESEIELTATDLQVGQRINIPAEILEGGTITVLASKLFEIAKELPEDEVLIAADEETCSVKVRSGKAYFDMKGLAADEFPMFPSLDKASIIPVSGSAIGVLLDKVAYAQSTDDSTSAKLCGIFLQIAQHDGQEVLRGVATDGHRLALAQAKIDGVEALTPLVDGVTLPSKGVNAVKKIVAKAGDVDIRIGFSNDGNEFIVVSQNTTLVARLIGESFPEYNKVIPRSTAIEVHIDRVAFLESAKRVSTLADGKGKMLSLLFEENAVQLEHKSTLGDSEEAMACQIDGDPIHLGVNYVYLIDSLKAMQGNRVTIKFNSPLAPLLVVPAPPEDASDSCASDSSEKYCAVVVPMKR